MPPQLAAVESPALGALPLPAAAAQTPTAQDDEAVARSAHRLRLGRMAEALAGHLGMAADAARLLRLAAPLHDIGELPAAAAEAPPRAQPQRGAALLSGSSLPLFALAAEIALHHRERWDGNGYPQGLRGDRIPLSARIVAVVDCFDALTMPRRYRPARADDHALAMLAEQAGSAFDPAIVTALIAHAGELIGLRDRIEAAQDGQGLGVKHLGTGLLAALGVATAAAAPPTPPTASQRVQASGELRVCIWPDYYGVSLRDPRTGRLSGIDIDLSVAFAADLKVRPVHVDSSFATLVDDLLNDRCDIAMFAVGMTAQRAQVLRFSKAYLESDIYAVTTRSSRVVQRWQDLDRPGVRVAVQAGTFMEPVMTNALKQATLVVVRPPSTRERELEAGRVDVFMTDYPYSRRLLDNADWARLVAPPTPFFVLPYAYAVKPGDAAWLAQVNDFVARIQRDGRLQSAAERHGLGAIVRLN